MAIEKLSRRESLIKKIKSGDKTAQTTSYLKRKRTLKKKSFELQTLCNVSVCMVCFGPHGDVTTWPESKKDVEAVVKSFKELKSRSEKSTNLEGLLSDEKKRLEKKRLKMVSQEKEKLEIDLGNWINGLKDSNSFENCLSYLDSKLSKYKEKIDHLKLTHEQEEEKRKEKKKDPILIENNINVSSNNHGIEYVAASGHPAPITSSSTMFNCPSTTPQDSNMHQNCIMTYGNLEPTTRLLTSNMDLRGSNCGHLQKSYCSAANFISENLLGANASNYVLPRSNIGFNSHTNIGNVEHFGLPNIVDQLRSTGNYLLNNDICSDRIWGQYYSNCTSVGPEFGGTCNNNIDNFFCYGDDNYYTNFVGNNYCQRLQFDQRVPTKPWLDYSQSFG